MSSHWKRMRVFVPVAALIGLAMVAPLSPAGASPSSSPGVAVAGPAVAVPQQVSVGTAKLVGATSPAQHLRLAVGLTAPKAAEEEAFLASLQDKKSPNFHHYLTAAQFNARFAPSAAAEASVVKWANANGLTVTQRYANRMVVDLDGSVAAVNKAFGVQINNYRLGTTSFYSNAKSAALPASLAKVVTSVQGLNSLQQLVPANGQQAAGPAYSAGPAKATAAGGHANGSRTALAKAMAASKKKLAAAGPTPGVTNGNYDPTDIYSSQAYDVDALNAQGHCCNPTHASSVTPAATSIAIATSGTHLGTDFSGFHNQYPYLAYHYQEFYIDGTPTSHDTEGTMDMEWSTAWANSFGSFVDTAMVYIYSGVNAQFTTFTDIWNHMASDNLARTMSTSWGCAESFCYDSGTVSTDHNIFNSMLAQGWTLVGISHDHGPYSDCAHVSANYPGSDPDLVSSGGTTLHAAGVFSSEVAWTGGSGAGSCASNNGGGGGGCSVFFSRPSWQSVASGFCSGRAEPDLALNASGIFQNIFDNGGLSGNGGTSIVAPEVSGQFAQMNAYLISTGACSTSFAKCPTIGDPHNQLYHQSPRNPYYDITSGCTSNDIGGGWCAGSGYDLATGLGSFNSLQLAWNVLYWSVAESTAPTVSITGPTTGVWTNVNSNLTWTVTDGGSPASGVAGYTARWDADPGDPRTEPHGGSGNSFYSGPAVKNLTSGSISLASAGEGCHTLYVRAWDNIGDSAVYTYGSVCYDATAPLVTSPPTVRIANLAFSGGLAPLVTGWTATDARSGINGYYVYRSDDGGSWVYQGFQAANSITQYLASGHKYQYATYALDNAGNLSAFTAGVAVTLHVVQETNAAITYSSGWTAASVAGASGGKVKYSTAAGKTATLSFSGKKVAWVTTLGSNRGSASVTIDGAGAKTVSTNAASTTPAYIVYFKATTTGPHTITVKNLATAGHARVDIDAFIWLS